MNLQVPGRARFFGLSALFAVFSAAPLAAQWTCVASNQLNEACLTAGINFANQITQTYKNTGQPPIPTIIFLGNGAFKLTKRLPEITGNVIIRGVGSATAIHGPCLNKPRTLGMCQTDGFNDFRVLKVNAGATLALMVVTIADGQEEGGGVYNAGSLQVTNSRFTRNHSHLRGSAILNKGSLSVTDSEFTENGNHNAGGGIDNQGSAEISGTTISGHLFGAAVINRAGGTLRLTNSTLYGNNFAAVNNEQSASMVLRSVTMANNTNAVMNAGYLYMWNSILAFNDGGGTGTSVECDSRYVTAPLYSFGGNVFRAGTHCNIAQISWVGDPDKVVDFLDLWKTFGTSKPELLDNGGPTCTVEIPMTSLAVNNANQSSYGCEQTDQRGIRRDNAIGGRCDSGAYEQTGQKPKTNLTCRGYFKTR